MPGTISQLADILLDVEKYTQWAYATKRCVLIKQTTKLDLIYYSEIAVPWPGTNRDFYATYSMKLDTVAQVLQVFSVGMRNYLPEKENLVRIPLSKGIWYAHAVAPKTIHLQYILQVDPGGSIPAWILNLFATKGPLETFENLRNKMKGLNK